MQIRDLSVIRPLLDDSDDVDDGNGDDGDDVDDGHGEDGDHDGDDGDDALGSNNVCICGSLGTQAYLYVQQQVCQHISPIMRWTWSALHQVYHVKNLSHV